MLATLSSLPSLPWRHRRPCLSLVSRSLLWIAVLLLTPIAVSAQAALHATENMSPWTVGGGFSNFDMGDDFGRMDGITAWVNWRVPTHMPIVNRLGLELEGRELIFQKPWYLERMRQETGLGGVTLELPGYRRLHPYAKGLIGMGGIYFATSGYDHDTRKVIAPGGGILIPVHGAWSLRGDYEYQIWRRLFGSELNPNGVTVGVTWNIARH